MDKLIKEKHDALNGVDLLHNSKYDIDGDDLNQMNNNMKNLSNLEDTKKENGIVTKNRTDKDYEVILNHFYTNTLADFTNYMGYGENEIKSIGERKFIDFMDWRCVEDIDRYKTDRIKAIPCVSCKDEFTTFQIDLGLCDKCKSKFDLAKFDEICSASEDREPGSSPGLIMMFVYMPDFRNMFSYEFPFNDKALLCATEDDFMGQFSKDFLLGFVDDKDKVSEFLSIISENIDRLNEFAKRRYESIKAILTSNDDVESKRNRVISIF